MTDLVLFWHRRDLRLHDNGGLTQAIQASTRVVGLFCFDPQLLHPDTVAPARVAYLLESLRELHHQYQTLGSQLLIVQGDPVETIPTLAQTLNVKAVYWNLDGEPYARLRDRTLTQALQNQGIPVHTTWDQLLHPPGTVLTGNQQPYTVYTPFWRNWHRQPKANPFPTPTHLQGLTPTELEQAQHHGAIALPTLRDLGFTWDGDWVLPPGETAALDRLTEFGHRALWEYQEQRNFPATSGTSRLSPALKFGTLGIRTLWATTQNALANSRSDEARASIQTWQQELAWREFYQHVLYFFPELADGPYRHPWHHFPWENNEDHFQAWCEGRTGYPIVDAAMRELNTTGWMHNRCRMIVASFLTKDLLINWQWGERYFMKTLVDGDLAANNGGWQWSASSGMDPKPLRIFNPATQSQKFDPEADYIRHWLPELASLDTAPLVTGKIPDAGDRLSYPRPLVNHNEQQRRFKHLYQQLKATTP